MIPLSESIKYAVAPLKVSANDKNQSIELALNSEGYYFHDKKWIAEGLSNIIKNAIEHTSIDGEIKIILEETPMSISITIGDNGEGIDECELKNIFKRFYKGKNSINPKSIGIGLSLSKKIIEAHGGSITAKSEIEKGTSFNIIFLIKKIRLTFKVFNVSLIKTDILINLCSYPISTIVPFLA